MQTTTVRPTVFLLSVLGGFTLVSGCDGGVITVIIPADTGGECVDDEDCEGMEDDLFCNGAAVCNDERMCVESMLDPCTGMLSGTDAGYPVECDEEANACVGCTEDAHCADVVPSMPFCEDGMCVECTENADCEGNGNGEVCDTSTHLCVECVAASDCGDGNECVDVACTANQCVTSNDDTNTCTDGTCHGGSCCMTCWDGDSCEVGTADAACGVDFDGAACNVCSDGTPLCITGGTSGTCVACNNDAQCVGNNNGTQCGAATANVCGCAPNEEDSGDCSSSTRGDDCLSGSCGCNAASDCDPGQACISGVCVATCTTPNARADVECNDGNSCTVDLCDPASHCFNAPSAGLLESVHFSTAVTANRVRVNSAFPVQLQDWRICQSGVCATLGDTFVPPGLGTGATASGTLIDVSGTLFFSTGGGEVALLPPASDPVPTTVCDYVEWDDAGNDFSATYETGAVATANWSAGTQVIVPGTTRTLTTLIDGTNGSQTAWHPDDEVACTYDTNTSGVASHTSVSNALWRLHADAGTTTTDNVYLVNSNTSIDGSAAAIDFAGYKLCFTTTNAQCISIPMLPVNEENVRAAIDVSAGLPSLASGSSGEIALIPASQDPGTTGASLTVCDYLQWGADLGTSLGEEAESDASWPDNGFVTVPGSYAAFDLAAPGFDATNNTTGVWDLDPCTAEGCASGSCQHFSMGQLLFRFDTAVANTIQLQQSSGFGIELADYSICTGTTVGSNCEVLSGTLASNNLGGNQVLTMNLPGASSSEEEVALAATDGSSNIVICDYVAYASDGSLDTAELRPAAVTAGQWSGATVINPGNDAFGVCDADNGLVVTWVPNCKQIYVTSSPWVTPNTGIAGADAHCMSDANHPGGGADYDAMIVDGTGRVACTSPNCTGPQGTDWVFLPNVPHMRLGTRALVGTTNGGGVFGDLGATPIAANGWSGSVTPVTIWTGLLTNWTSSADDCTNWSSGDMGVNGATGTSNATGTAAINTGITTCNTTTNVLVCVEQ